MIPICLTADTLLLGGRLVCPFARTSATQMIFKGPTDFGSPVRRRFPASRNRLPTSGGWSSPGTGRLVVTQRSCSPACSWAILSLELMRPARIARSPGACRTILARSNISAASLPLTGRGCISTRQIQAAHNAAPWRGLRLDVKPRTYGKNMRLRCPALPFQWRREGLRAP